VPPSPNRKLRRTTLFGGAALLIAAAIPVAVVTLATNAVASPQTATGAGGVNTPYTEVQAESSPTNGTIIGPSYTQGQLADEASGREAVTLQGTGKYVTFTTPVATNSIDFRYSIPDSSSGSVYTTPLSLYINGAKQTDFTLTNAYSWYYGAYPYTNTPSSGTPQHFYDEVHRLLPTTYPAGTTFKLQVDSEDTASSYTIDLADFEDVAAPLAQPAGSISVTSKGADPTGAADSTNAFNAAISAAGPGGTVWIPSGTYDIPGHIIVNDVTVEGAGMWYSTITGAAPGFYGNGTPSNSLPASTDVHLANFAIFGNVQERVDADQVNGIGGAMSDSTVSDIWIEHEKVGAWMDGPMTNLTFTGMRIRDTTADGINLDGASTDSTITGSDIRNTGDDGIALWSNSSVGADTQDTVSDNVVQLQQLANGIAVYGGENNTVTGNLVEDTGINQGGGITVAQRFTSTPVGKTTISNNTLIRDGDLDPNWLFGVGALWFDGSQAAVAGPIDVTNALIEQSPYEAVQWVEGTVSGVSLNNVSIIGTGTFAFQQQTPGSATMRNVTATGVAQANQGKAPSYSCEGSNFTITDDGGNSGVTPTQCNGWPTPVYPPYPAATVSTTPPASPTSPTSTPPTGPGASPTPAGPTPTAPAVTNLALKASITASSHTQNYVATNANDGNTGTYWESTDGVWPATLTVNLGATHSLSSATVDLPPSSAWQTRTQTFSILGSTNGSTWTTLAGSAAHTFNPSTGNTVTVNLPSGTSEQYIELDFTANNVQNGAQVSEFEVMGH
jgi:F5/8 type C domain/Pectate lyase superfamily protein